MDRALARCPGRGSEQTRFRLRASEEGSGLRAPASASGASRGQSSERAALSLGDVKWRTSKSAIRAERANSQTLNDLDR